MIINTVFFGNEASEGQEIYLNHYLDTLDIAFCNIDQGLIYGNIYDGGGNINGNPLFDDPELLTLLEDSPCIDFGTQAYICSHDENHLCPQNDILGIPRPQCSSIDIGAYESLCVSVIETAVGSRQSAVIVYPNPTGGIFDCRLSMVDCRWVSLKIYNAQGQEVATVLNEKLPAGEHTVRWDAGALPAGIYYYQLRAKGAGQVGAGKLVKY